MITWMQKHKKWLVITIWISTIAFVGAGFVGWGSYEYGKSSGAVAVVGDRKVSFEEYQREYSNLYQQYSQIFGSQFNQEMAKQLNLSQAAYQLTIEKNLIMSFGDELGLDVTDEDIAKELVQIPAFIKNGKFDKNTYIKVLTQNGTNAQDFEATIKRAVLLRKVEQLFQVNAQNGEVKSLNQLLFAEDKVSIKVLDQDSITVKVDAEKLKEYWEKNKNKYISENAYELAFSKYPIVEAEHSAEDIKNHYSKFKTDFKKEDGKIKPLEESLADIKKALDAKAAKKAALKKFIKLKKGEVQFENPQVIYENNLNFDVESIEKIKTAKAGEVIKPFVNGNEYVTVKVINTILPKPLSFDKAKPMATIDYTNELKSAALFAQVKTELENFKGKDIGYVSRSSANKIPGLNPEEAMQFLTQLFSIDKKKGDISLGTKVVLYEILDSRLASYDASRDSAVKSTLKQLQDSELRTNLVKRLENLYEVQSSQSEEQSKEQKEK